MEIVHYIISTEIGHNALHLEPTQQTNANVCSFFKILGF